MPSKLKIYPYKLSSGSAKALAERLDIKKVRANGNYYHYPNHTIINWGNSTLPSWFNSSLKHKWLNLPENVAKATNKLSTFVLLKQHNVSIPEFTTDFTVAKAWAKDEGKIVVARSTLTGNSGAGIYIIDPSSEEDYDYTRNFPLWTKHLRHKFEYRVHVFKETVLDVTQKKKKSGEQNVDQYVRSHKKGWVFCRENIIVPDIVLEEALKAVTALKLDFGAVDIGYREREDKAFVFEVNTAPGIEGITLEKYIGALNEMVS